MNRILDRTWITMGWLWIVPWWNSNRIILWKCEPELSCSATPRLTMVWWWSTVGSFPNGCTTPIPRNVLCLPASGCAYARSCRRISPCEPDRTTSPRRRRWNISHQRKVMWRWWKMIWKIANYLGLLEKNSWMKVIQVTKLHKFHSQTSSSTASPPWRPWRPWRPLPSWAWRRWDVAWRVPPHGVRCCRAKPRLQRLPRRRCETWTTAKAAEKMGDIIRDIWTSDNLCNLCEFVWKIGYLNLNWLVNHHKLFLFKQQFWGVFRHTQINLSLKRQECHELIADSTPAARNWMVSVGLTVFFSASRLSATPGWRHATSSAMNGDIRWWLCFQRNLQMLWDLVVFQCLPFIHINLRLFVNINIHINIHPPIRTRTPHWSWCARSRS